MPPYKTSAERTRKYRAKLSKEKKDEIKKKNATQQRLRRSKFTSLENRKQNSDAKLRMRKFREKKRKAQHNYDPQNVAFTTRQSFCRAVKRVSTSLPSSPRKKKAVVIKLAEKLGVLPMQPLPRSGIAEDIVDAVIQHFNSDLISRQLPGQKDCIKIKTESGKQLVQKRVLIMTVMEAYRLFKEENPDKVIGKSKFSSLRPAHIVPVSHKDHTVCCCIYHENGDMLLDGIKKIFKNIPSNINLLVAESVCAWKLECHTGVCEKCNNTDEFLDRKLPIPDNDMSIVGFYQWNKENKKELISSTLEKAKEELARQLPVLRRHCFVSKVQLQQMKLLKLSLEKNGSQAAILHEDFSENFQIKQQNEIMAAHWVSESVTIFTAIIYRSAKNYLSYVVVSDESHHDKFSIACFNKKILEYDIVANGPIKTLHCFSDGAGSQFKNRYTMSTILNPKEFHAEIETVDWSFFGTAHGKGPIDGLGGTVKRAVWKRILQKKAVVITPKDFFEVARQACPNMKILFVSKEDIAATEEKMQKSWEICTPKAIPNTQKMHYARRLNDQNIEVGIISPFSSEHTVHYQKVKMIDDDKVKLSSFQYKLNDYVVVEYAGEHYPGIIEDIANDELFVRTLHPCRGGWMWPNPKDVIWYPTCQIVKKISSPMPVNSRGVYSFKEPV